MVPLGYTGNTPLQNIQRPNGALVVPPQNTGNGNGNGPSLPLQNYSGPGNGGLQAPAGPQGPEVKQSFMKMARALAHMSGNIVLPTSGEEDFDSFQIQLPDGPLLPINVGKLAERAPTLSALVLTFLASRLMQIQLKAADPTANDLGETIKQQLTDFATTYKAFVQKLDNPGDILPAADVMATNSATNASKAVVSVPAYFGYKQYLYAPGPGKAGASVIQPGATTPAQLDPSQYHTFSITREFWNQMLKAQADEARASEEIELDQQQQQDRLLTRLAERFGAYVNIPNSRSQANLTAYVPRAFYDKNQTGSIQPKKSNELAKVQLKPSAFSNSASLVLPSNLGSSAPSATVIEEVLSPKGSKKPAPLVIPNGNANALNSRFPGPSSAPANMNPFGSMGRPNSMGRLSPNSLFDLGRANSPLPFSGIPTPNFQPSPMGSPGSPMGLSRMPLGPPTSGPIVPVGRAQGQQEPLDRFTVPGGYYQTANSGQLPLGTLGSPLGSPYGSQFGSPGSPRIPEFDANAPRYGGGKKKAAKKPLAKAKKSTETKTKKKTAKK